MKGDSPTSNPYLANKRSLTPQNLNQFTDTSAFPLEQPPTRKPMAFVSKTDASALTLNAVESVWVGDLDALVVG